jgi:hypothetical protein
MALLQKAYLGATPLFRNVDWFQDKFAFLEASSATTVTANTSAHTKGSYSQLIASTASNASLLVVLVGGIHAGNTNTATLVDIATGASGSETDVAANIAVGGASVASTAPNGIVIPIPLKVPSGTRLSARIQSVVTGGKTASVTAFLFDSGDYATAPTTVDVLGTNTATSEGTQLSNTANAWAQIIASTSQAYRAISMVPSLFGNNADTRTVRYEIGVGASGSEAAFGVLNARSTSEETMNSSLPSFSLASASLPTGSRLAVRQDSGVGARYGVTLIGIP